MANNKNYDSKPAVANKFLNPNGTTSTLDEIITQVVPDTTSVESTGTATKEYQSKPAVANKFLNTDGSYSTLDEILARTIGGGIGQFDVEVVEELPETGEKGVIYLVPNEGSGEDIYDEYIWIPSTNSFEKIGSTAIDLSGYEQTANKVTSISASSTDTQYPTAKLLYDQLQLKQNSLTAGNGIDITSGTISTTLEDITLIGDYAWLTPGEYTISTATEIAKLEELETKIRAGRMPNLGFELYNANAKIKITHFEYDSNFFWLNGLWYTDFNSIGVIGIRILRETESDVDTWTIQTEECNTTYSDFIGTDGSSAGTAGLVPAPTASDIDKYLKSDGTWSTVVSGASVTYVTYGVSTWNDVLTAYNRGDTIFCLVNGSTTNSKRVVPLSYISPTNNPKAAEFLFIKHYSSHSVGSTPVDEFIKYSIDNGSVWHTNNDTPITSESYTVFTGTNGSAGGENGLVPAPTSSDTDKYLKSDGTWGTVSSGSTYTAGANIDITNDVISVDGILPDTEYTSITQGWTNGQYYQNVEAHEQLPEPTQNANAKTLTYQNTSFGDEKVTFRITGKCTDYMIIMYDGSMVDQVDDYNETKTNYIYTVDTLYPYRSIIFNFTNTDTNPPSVEIVTETGALRDYFEKKTDNYGTKTALSLGVERASNVIGENSIAQGHAGYASGTSSCAFCSGTASGSYSFTAGGRATGSFSNALGSSAEASGSNSTAIGQNASASGKNSIAFGYYTAANTAYQQVEGKFNILDTGGSTTTQGTYAHIVGNGTSVNASKRSNAYTLDWSGNGWFSGDVYVGSTGGKNKDAGSKKLATDDTFTGTNGSAAGVKGLVPAPTASDANKYLKSDGTWATVSGGGSSYTAGDNIDITNNTISVTGIIPHDETTPITNFYNDRTYDDTGLMLYAQNAATCHTSLGLAGTYEFIVTGKAGSIDVSGDIHDVAIWLIGEDDSGISVEQSGPTGVVYNNKRISVTTTDDYQTITFCFTDTDLISPSVAMTEHTAGVLDDYTKKVDIIPEPQYIAMEFINGRVYDMNGEAHSYQNTAYSVMHVTTPGTYTFKVTGKAQSIITSESTPIAIWLVAEGESIYTVLSHGPSSVDYTDQLVTVVVEDSDVDIIFNFTDTNTKTPSLYRVVGGTSLLDPYYVRKEDIFSGTSAGLVPSASAGDTGKYLKSDGTWATPSGGGGTYTAGDNIDITNNVISVTGFTTGSDYVPLEITETGTVYKVDSTEDKAYTYEIQNSAYYKYHTETQGTYTFKVTGKVMNVDSNNVPIWFVGSDDSDFYVNDEGPYSVTYTNEIVTITTDENYHDIVFNFMDTDLVTPSLSVLQSVPGLLDSYVTKSGDTMTGKLIAPKLEIGVDNNATGYCSCAIGERNTAAGYHSYASGYVTNASGSCSHAEGAYTEATGLNSHAEGRKTTAQRKNQHVEGEYNILDTTGASETSRGEYIHIAGNGDSDRGIASYRSNAYTLDWSGNAWFAGDVYVGSTSGKNKDAGSKKLSTLDYTKLSTSATDCLVAKSDRLLQVLFGFDTF